MKICDNILTISLITLFSCNSSSIDFQDIKAIDSILHPSVHTSLPLIGVGIVRDGDVIYEKYRVFKPSASNPI